MRLICAVLAILVAGTASAQNSSEEAAVIRAGQRGARMYSYDQAAWHGTDDMLAKLKDGASKVGGYIVDGPATAPRLIFFDKPGRSAIYIARFAEGRLVEGRVLSDSDDRSLSPLDLRMVAALATARTALAGDKNARGCSAKPFNTVVLPPDTPDGAIPVYFLTPQTSNDRMPFGGHYEVDVDAAGNPGTVRHFANSCLEVETRPKLKTGAKPEYLVVSHLLDPVPTEIHVFNSLALRIPVMVVVSQPSPRIWPVAGARISTPVSLDSKK